MPQTPPPLAVTGIVLAGGRSRRMGSDKTALLLDGETLLQRTARALAEVVGEVVVVVAPQAPLPDLDLPCPWRVLRDPVEGDGPLAAMATGLEAARTPIALVVGADMPFLRPALLRLLLERLEAEAGARWVLPVAGGRAQPLCSAIARSALPVLRTHLDAGDRAPMSLAADLDAVRVDEAEWRVADPEGVSFLDLDTPEDVAAARARLHGLRGG